MFRASEDHQDFWLATITAKVAGAGIELWKYEAGVGTREVTYSLPFASLLGVIEYWRLRVTAVGAMIRVEVMFGYLFFTASIEARSSFSAGIFI